MESGNKKFIVKQATNCLHDDLFKSKFPLHVFWRFDHIFDFGILIRIALVFELAISCSALLL
jgi:Ser/Thr protein kinase RdoA (MazF antagonist)